MASRVPTGDAARRLPRRQMLGNGLAALTMLSSPTVSAAQAGESDWYLQALRMKVLAESSGDQPYGAVLVLDGRVVGEGPSRVVLNRDPTAHAEREAIRDAQRRLPGRSLAGSVLVSTSRPCSACEAAAAEVGVQRLVHGAALIDAGAPRR